MPGKLGDRLDGSPNRVCWSGSASKVAPSVGNEDLRPEWWPRRRCASVTVRRMRVGMLTGGGDSPGLNAVIRAIVRKGETVYGDTLVGFHDAWSGVLEPRYTDL